MKQTTDPETSAGSTTTGLSGRHRDEDGQHDDDGDDDRVDPLQDIQEVPEPPSSLETQRPQGTFYQEFDILAHLVFFSFSGTLARIGLRRLTISYGRSPPVLTSVLWANLTGCLIIGFLDEGRKLFNRRRQQQQQQREEQVGTLSQRGSISIGVQRQPPPKNFNSPLYIGLSTGFCGCLTSFSSLMGDLLLGLYQDSSASSFSFSSSTNTTATATNTGPGLRPPGQAITAILALMIIHPCVCFCALQCGIYLASIIVVIIMTSKRNIHPLSSSSSHSSTRRTFRSMVVVFIPFATWLVVIILSIWPPSSSHRHTTATDENHTIIKERPSLIFPLVFAPLGCLLRYYISRPLNGLSLKIPRYFSRRRLCPHHHHHHHHSPSSSSSSSSSSSFIDIARFPFGTLLVNILGTILFIVSFGLQSRYISIDNRHGNGNGNGHRAGHNKVAGDGISSGSSSINGSSGDSSSINSSISSGKRWASAVVHPLLCTSSYLASSSRSSLLIRCQILEGIQSGLCGCLTTVSTLILELRHLHHFHHLHHLHHHSHPSNFHHTLLYGFLTSLLGLGSVLVIVASMGGFSF